jgi:hypothetical protein
MANIKYGETEKHKKITIKIKEEKKVGNDDVPELVLLTIGEINGKKALFTSPKTRNEAKYLISELTKLSAIPFDVEHLLEPVGIIFAVKKNNILETGEKLED